MSLEPHLGFVMLVRTWCERQRNTQNAVGEVVSHLTKSGLEFIPGVDTAMKVWEFFQKRRAVIKARNEQAGLQNEIENFGVLQLTRQRDMDLQERTLQDLGLVLGQAQTPVPESLPEKIQRGIKNTLSRTQPMIDDLGQPLPCIVFCDDAQFTRQDGDLSAHAFLKELYERAHRARWPLLLVLTHWQLDWDEARRAWEIAQQQTATADDTPASRLGPSLAYDLQRFIHEDERPYVEIPIPKEETVLQDIVTAPACPAYSAGAATAGQGRWQSAGAD